MDFKKLIGDLTDEQLVEFKAAVSKEAEARRPKVSLEDIKPNMTREEVAAVRAEIARALNNI